LKQAKHMLLDAKTMDTKQCCGNY